MGTTVEASTLIVAARVPLLTTIRPNLELGNYSIIFPFYLLALPLLSPFLMLPPCVPTHMLLFEHIPYVYHVVVRSSKEDPTGFGKSAAREARVGCRGFEFGHLRSIELNQF